MLQVNKRSSDTIYNSVCHMIGSVDFVNLTGGYTLISVIQAFCSTVMSAVGGVVIDIDPSPATTYNNYRVTQTYIDIADNPTLACSCILHCISKLPFFQLLSLVYGGYLTIQYAQHECSSSYLRWDFFGYTSHCTPYSGQN